MRNIKYIINIFIDIQNFTKIMKNFKYYSSLTFAFFEMCNLNQIIEKIKNLIFSGMKNIFYLKYIFCSIDSSLLNNEHSITV
jgi:hypothetical protein